MKKRIAALLAVVSLLLLLTGCFGLLPQKAESTPSPSEKPAASAEPAVSAQPSSTEMQTSSEKPSPSEKPSETPASSPEDSLKNWAGDYWFDEYSPPDKNMWYRLSITEKNGAYSAELNIDGWQTMLRLQATVTGDEKSIDLVFEKYLPDNMFEIYQKGDILLTLKMSEGEVCTYWGEITPMLYENEKPGQVYFEKGEKPV